MATVYGDRQARVEKAADLLRLSVRLPEAAEAYRNFVGTDAALASEATQFLAAVNMRNAAEAAALVNKGSRGCAGCGKALKSGRAMCGKCTKAVIIGGDGKPGKERVMAKKIKPRKLRKMRERAAVKAAYKSATGGAYNGVSKGAALNKMWQASLSSPDPAERLIAERFLAK